MLNELVSEVQNLEGKFQIDLKRLNLYAENAYDLIELRAIAEWLNIYHLQMTKIETVMHIVQKLGINYMFVGKYPVLNIK